MTLLKLPICQCRSKLFYGWVLLDFSLAILIGLFFDGCYPNVFS